MAPATICCTLAISIGLGIGTLFTSAYKCAVARTKSRCLQEKNKRHVVNKKRTGETNFLNIFPGPWIFVYISECWDRNVWQWRGSVVIRYYWILSVSVTSSNDSHVSIIILIYIFNFVLYIWFFFDSDAF